MSFLLFAFDKRRPNGGMDDVASIFDRAPTDQEVFESVVAQIRNDDLDLEPVLSLQLVPLLSQALDATEFFEFRTAQNLSSPSFRFAVLAEDLPDLGPCALVPVTRVSDPNGVVWEYCSRDPEQALF